MEPKYYGKTQQELEKQISEEYDSYKKQDEEWLKKQEVRHSNIIYDIPKADEALEAYKKGNKEEYVRIIVDGLMETAKSVDLKNTLTKFLQNGGLAFG
ncbi:MAG: hypothetical protein FWC26_14530 [Fibromonadales bacterium]|nr:hypothetical protein [Fibromonadales bacterium]